ncbi:MAG: hypothetical protein WCX65_14585 [bacterium]
MNKDFLENYERAVHPHNKTTLEYLDANNLNSIVIREIIIPRLVLLRVFPRSILRITDPDHQFEFDQIDKSSWSRIRAAIETLKEDIKNEAERLGYDGQGNLIKEGLDKNEFEQWRESIVILCGSFEEANEMIGPVKIDDEGYYFRDFTKDFNFLRDLYISLVKYEEKRNHHKDILCPDGNNRNYNLLITYIKDSLVKHLINVKNLSRRKTGFVVSRIFSNEYGIIIDPENIRTNINNTLIKSDIFPL